ncbi:hypothetical protein T492DRAFT_127139 [Pavlovales sp. CCMP2436]|nr:hypothetical protein T492DRAFT_127139 [Pavlovales sp. CCMP2436]
MFGADAKRAAASASTLGVGAPLARTALREDAVARMNDAPPDAGVVAALACGCVAASGARMRSGLPPTATRSGLANRRGTGSATARPRLIRLPDAARSLESCSAGARPRLAGVSCFAENSAKLVGFPTPFICLPPSAGLSLGRPLSFLSAFTTSSARLN